MAMSLVSPEVRDNVENRIRVLRGEQGWSQAELGKRLRVSRQTVNAIEKGRYDPSLPLAFRIARLFELRIEEIFTAQDESQDGGAEASDG